MPKDPIKSIDFLDAYNTIIEEPVRDTIRDTVRADTTPIQQESLSRDTIIQDTTIQDTTGIIQQEPADIHEDTTSLQDTSFIQRDTVSTPTDTAIQQPTPAPVQTVPPADRQTSKQEPGGGLYQIFGVTEMPIAPRLEEDPAYINFLYHIPAVHPGDSLQTNEIFRPTGQSPQTTIKQEPPQIKENPIPSPGTDDYDWITFVLIGALLLIGWTRLFYKKYFIALAKSFHFYNYASSLYYGRNSLTERAAILLNLNFFITGGLVIFQASHHSGFNLPSIEPYYIWLAFTGFLITWYAWNFLTTNIIGHLFLRSKPFNEYLHNYNLYRKLMGISLLPVAIVVQFIREEYSSLFLLIGAILIGILFITHILRGLQIFIKEGVSIFYLFLYLCALEFLPILIAFEVFIRELS